MPQPVGSTSSPTTPESKHVRLLVAAISLPVTLFVVLLRYAIDLLGLVCIVMIVARSTRDALADWWGGDSFDEELDARWAIAAVAVGIVGTAVSVVWLFSTSDSKLLADLQTRLPPSLVRTLEFAEQRGWGQRAFLAHGRSRGAAAAVADAGRSSPTGAMARSGAIGDTAGTSGVAARPSSEAESSRRKDPRISPHTGAVDTAITLTASQTRTPSGISVTLTAQVTASASQQPHGRVTFRRGERVLGIASIGTDGRASLSVSDLPVGFHTITAEFTGADPFSRSETSVVVQVDR